MQVPSHDDLWKLDIPEIACLPGLLREFSQLLKGSQVKSCSLDYNSSAILITRCYRGCLPTYVPTYLRTDIERVLNRSVPLSSLQLATAHPSRHHRINP